MVQEVNVINVEFSDYVESSIKRLNIKKDIYVESYIVSLLSKFIQKEEDFLSEQPLIFRLVNSKSLDDFVKIGDETLFVTGFFPEVFLKDKKKGYVVNIGKDSYLRAAVKLDYEGEGYIYSVLSKRFERYSDVINDIRYNMLENLDDQEFFGIYKIWTNYKNERALEKLKQEGFTIE